MGNINSILYLIPRELVNIIFSYLDITELTQFIKDNNELFDLINTKTFWVNYTVINGLSDYVSYFNLMLNTDSDVNFHEAYEKILIIDNFLSIFMSYGVYRIIFELPVSTQDEELFESEVDLNWRRLCNPKDLSFFQNYINFDTISKLINRYDTHYPEDQLTIEIEYFNDHFTFKGINKYLISEDDFIIILIKSMIVGIDIWNPLISNLRLILDYIGSLNNNNYSEEY
jgi:hypothetical protein